MAANHFADNYNSGIDPTAEMDCYFDFSQAEYLSQPSSSRPSVSKLSPSSISTDPISNMVSPDQDRKPQFPGPSHDYNLYKQQTPFAPGAVSKVTTVSHTFDSDAKYSMNTADLNFGSSMGYNSGMDLDFESSSSSTLPVFFYPSNDSPSDEYVDPTAMTAEEPPSNVGRLWPGMHSQQAEQAKAEADAKRQQHQHMIMQRAQKQSTSIQSHSKARSHSHVSTDPAVEERISRLLDQMRQSSSSSFDHDATSPTDSMLPNIARMRKDEEDMDDDERLLASEEGKKLSSKERRQLRNKVSARAFRSRRKEYISQLEGEVNAKSEECDELRMQVRRLNDQNAQLTSLTQTLLRHPAFSTVLTEMSNDPTIIAPPQQQPAPKDVNPYQVPHEQGHQNIQVGMTMIPENSLDFSTLNIGTNSWNNGDMYSYQQPQVFSVFNLPDAPSIHAFRTDLLSGKSESTSQFSNVDAKLDAPVIKSIPAASKEASVEAVLVDTSDIQHDPTFALYVDSDFTPAAPTITVHEASYQLESSITGKPIKYSLFSAPIRSTTPKDLDRLFAAADASLKRLEALLR